MAAEYLSMASLPILAFTIVAARPIVTFLFGAEFAAAAPALPVLAGAFVSISFGYLVGNMVVILELQRVFLRNAAVGLVINVVLNVVFIPRYGFQAAAWITLLTEATVMSLSMREVLRALAMRPRLERFARVLAAALVMGAVVGVARAAGAPLGALAAIAAVLYPLDLVLLRALSRGELVSVLRREPLTSSD